MGMQINILMMHGIATAALLISGVSGANAQLNDRPAASCDGGAAKDRTSSSCRTNAVEFRPVVRDHGIAGESVLQLTNAGAGSPDRSIPGRTHSAGSKTTWAWSISGAPPPCPYLPGRSSFVSASLFSGARGIAAAIAYRHLRLDAAVTNDRWEPARLAFRVVRHAVDARSL